MKTPISDDASTWIGMEQEYCAYEGDYVDIIGTGVEITPAVLSRKLEIKLIEAQNRIIQLEAVISEATPKRVTPRDCDPPAPLMDVSRMTHISHTI